MSEEARAKILRTVIKIFIFARKHLAPLCPKCGWRMKSHHWNKFECLKCGYNLYTPYEQKN